MNREILFRGKRVDNEAWETGSLVVQWPYTSREKVFITDKNTAHHTPVDPSTVGQYTGLMDRNGKRIFEGDVVEYGGGKYKVVFVSNPHAYFGLDMIQEFGEIWPFSHSVPAGIMTVIGNIHDNPELLEV